MIVLPMVQCQRMLRNGLYPSPSTPLALTQQTSRPLHQFTEVRAHNLCKALGLEP
jgi:hypothetical protein